MTLNNENFPDWPVECLQPGVKLTVGVEPVKHGYSHRALQGHV